jgi:hypothetical protein
MAYFATRRLNFVADNLTDEKANRLFELSPYFLSEDSNLEFHHEQLFFEDGKEPSNIGFALGDSGKKDEDRGLLTASLKGAQGKLFSEDAASLELYESRGQHYDDQIMREAVKKVGNPDRYHLLRSNCQHWAESVRQEYHELVREREFEEDDSSYGDEVEVTEQPQNPDINLP